MAYKHILNGDYITSNSIATNNSGGVLDDNICVVSATEPSTFRKKIWIQKGKNLCDANGGAMNCMLSNSDGKTMSAATNIWVSDYISVRPNTQYLMSSNGSGVYVRSFFYNADKDFISTQAANLSFTTSSSTYYVRLQFDRSTYSTNLQLEQNSSVTTYEAYIEPKYYVLNNNNVYEELNRNKEKEIYSTGETIVGTWIDGKPIYRKVIEFTVTSSWQGIGSFSNISNFIKVSAVRKGASSGNIYPYHADSNNYAYFYIPTNKTSIYLASAGETNITNLLIVEYTKSTD